MTAVDCSQVDLKVDTSDVDWQGECALQRNGGSPTICKQSSPYHDDADHSKENCDGSDMEIPGEERKKKRTTICKQSSPDHDDADHSKENCDGSDMEIPGEERKKKRRRRRHKGGKNHRRWKPYDKLSWSEKRELEEKETRRANQKRAEAFASGHPVAPYNTTQFLMNDHIENERIEHDLNRHNSKGSNDSGCTDTSDEWNESAEEDYMAREFSETYDNIHAERLNSMTKEELIKNYVEMESKLEQLEKTMTDKTNSGSDVQSISSGGEETVDMKEFIRLKEENKKLVEENSRLRSELVTVLTDDMNS
ncbi:hypothetical protein ACJMK2_022206 [Sinanodonta woodiana]|uniref:Uncharacterized protein n=1 Tax=Sinanodonta woodiana TaxID=1069815 RepID=A0ABD3TJH7_SINWO